MKLEEMSTPEIRRELHALWMRGVPVTWTRRQLRRWQELVHECKKRGLDVSKKHFFLDKEPCRKEA